jgi:carboxylesterase type B
LFSPEYDGFRYRSFFLFPIMYRSLVSFATVSFLTTWTSPSHAKLIGNATTPIVDLGYAQYRGNTSFVGTNVFYGIHYAQPPTGELRWQPPQDIENQNDFTPTEVLNAESPGPSCVQGNPAWRVPQRDNKTAVPQTGEEDCLRLDVVVPTKPNAPLLPVLVMIHGGGFTQGSSYAVPGSTMVNTSDGSMIYVSLQYRLGVYGFLSGAEVRENGKANVGLLDQRAALGWVQRNIRAFGGDPSKVTIIGGSAGGSSGEWCFGDCLVDWLIFC